VIDQKFADFQRFFSDLLHLRPLFYDVKVLTDMIYATPRRGYHIIKFSEVFNEQFHSLLGVSFIAGISHGLSTAGLIGRYAYFMTKFLQKLQGSNGYLRIKLIYITRNK
jgi:hypothetical protein